eukprot:4491014-Pleurochrysis_carterae.AAC.1
MGFESDCIDSDAQYGGGEAHNLLRDSVYKPCSRSVWPGTTLPSSHHPHVRRSPSRVSSLRLTRPTAAPLRCVTATTCWASPTLILNTNENNTMPTSSSGARPHC